MILQTLSISELLKLVPEGKHNPSLNIFSAAPLKIVDAFEYTGCMCSGFHINRDSMFSFSNALRTISLALGYNLLSNEAMVSQELEISS